VIRVNVIKLKILYLFIF